MKKFPAEKVNTALSIVTMLFVAIIWWGDKNAKDGTENGVQNEQIKYLTQQVQELKESFKDLSNEVHGMMAIHYARGDKNANS